MKTTSDSPTLQHVKKGKLCTGCGGCAALAPGRIEMRLEAPGYLRPHQTGAISPQIDEQIAQICPGLHQSAPAETSRVDPIWGSVLELKEGHATDPEIRHKGSSGGALSATIIHLLETGEIDSAVQTVQGSPAIANASQLSTNRDAVANAAGSRYAPSAPLAGIDQLLEGTARHAFVGKPCDVAALRKLQAIDQRARDRFVYLISFFCAGVPSQSGARALLTELGTDSDEVERFRYRGHGWPGHAHAALRDGRELTMDYDASWGDILSKHVQHRCKICADGVGLSADLVFADAWVCDETGSPSFEERNGLSLIVARTAKGKSVLSKAEAAGRIRATPFNPSKLAQIQPGQVRKKTSVLPRLAALRLLRKPTPRYHGMRLGRAAWQAPISSFLRNFLGMARRIVVGEF